MTIYCLKNRFVANETEEIQTAFASLKSLTCLSSQFWTNFIHCSGNSIFDFERINTDWEGNLSISNFK